MEGKLGGRVSDVGHVRIFEMRRTWRGESEGEEDTAYLECVLSTEGTRRKTPETGARGRNIVMGRLLDGNNSPSLILTEPITILQRNITSNQYICWCSIQQNNPYILRREMGRAWPCARQCYQIFSRSLLVISTPC